MPGGDTKRKKWSEMTRFEIVAALSAYTLIAGAIIGWAIYRIATVSAWNAWVLVWPAPLALPAGGLVGVAYFQAIRELRCRGGEHRLTSRSA